MIKRICYSCLYFRPTVDREDVHAARGECRRLAPRPETPPRLGMADAIDTAYAASQGHLVPAVRSGPLAAWPIVRGLDWCGQWRSYRERPSGWPVRDHE